MYFCLYLFLLYIESPSATLLVDPALPSWNLDTHLTYKKKQRQVVGFVCNFLIHLFHTGGFQEKRSRNFSSFSSAFFEPKGVEELNSKGCFWNWLSSKVWQRLTKKGVSWVNLSLLIYYWWIEVASDGFLAWCDMMPRAFCTLGGQDDTSETRTGSRSRVLSSTRSGFLLGHPFTGELSMRSQKAGFSHIVFLLPCFIFPCVYI